MLKISTIKEAIKLAIFTNTISVASSGQRNALELALTAILGRQALEVDVSSGVSSSTARLVRPVQTVPCTVTPLGTSDALSPVGTRPLVKHAVANSAVVASVMTPTVQLVRVVGTIGATWKHEKATLLATQRGIT